MTVRGMASPAIAHRGVSAAAKAAISAIAIVIALRLLLTSEQNEDPATWSDLAASLAFTCFALAIALVVVVPRAEAATPAAAATAALALAVLSLLALPVFWFSGAPFALGASAAWLSRSAAAAGASRASRATATALGGLVAFAALAISIAATISQFDPTLPQ